MSEEKSVDIIETRGKNSKWLLATSEINGTLEGAEPRSTLWEAASEVIARRKKAGDKSVVLGILVRKADGTDIGYWFGRWDGGKVVNLYDVNFVTNNE